MICGIDPLPFAISLELSFREYPDRQDVWEDQKPSEGRTGLSTTYCEVTTRRVCRIFAWINISMHTPELIMLLVGARTECPFHPDLYAFGRQCTEGTG